MNDPSAWSFLASEDPLFDLRADRDIALTVVTTLYEHQLGHAIKPETLELLDQRFGLADQLDELDRALTLEAVNHSLWNLPGYQARRTQRLERAGQLRHRRLLATWAWLTDLRWVCLISYQVHRKYSMPYEFALVVLTLFALLEISPVRSSPGKALLRMKVVGSSGRAASYLQMMIRQLQPGSGIRC